MVKKIVVIGNSAAGKTKMSRRLAELHQLPLTHVDQMQFLPGLVMRPHKETQQMLDQVMQRDSWLIDGFGPLDSLETRFAYADVIVYFDWPLWRHYWWLAKRQLTNIWNPRPELPMGSSELTWSHTQKMIQTIWKVHKQMRPELLRILNRTHFKQKVLIIRDMMSWNELYKKGIQ